MTMKTHFNAPNIFSYEGSFSTTWIITVAVMVPSPFSAAISAWNFPVSDGLPLIVPSVEDKSIPSGILPERR